MLPTDPPDPAAQALVKAALATADRLCRTVGDHVTPDLYRYASDRGALSWKVDQEITWIKESYRDDRSHGRDQGGPPSVGW